MLNEPDEKQPRRRDQVRERARSAAPYALAALVGAGVAAAALSSRRTSVATVAPPLPTPALPPVPPAPRLRPPHVVSEHVRAGRPVTGYVRPRVRRGHESLTAQQLARALAA
jgi:hypothetical protein